MIYLSRRSFITGIAAMPFFMWFQKYGAAQTPTPKTPLTRYDAWSPQGKAMLKTYARAVQIMKSKPPSDPRSWVFQWYIHWVKGDGPGPTAEEQKQAEITEIFQNNSTYRDLAQATWDTCQGHGLGAVTFGNWDENWFCPWHRMYIYYFERIIRSVSGDPSFTLPYWNYLTSNFGPHGVLPPEFRMPDDPTFRSLYVENRNVQGPNTPWANINDGEPIDKNLPSPALDYSTAFSQCTYQFLSDAEPGFVGTLDLNPHGLVHVLVGDVSNMGSVPSAANDPIFWLHHSNIDRLWASWNRPGNQNPDIQNATFTFADESGNPAGAQKQVQDVLNISDLGYTYDSFETVTKCTIPLAILTEKVVNVTRLAATQKSVALGTEPVRVTLEPPLAAPEARLSFAARVKALKPDQRLYLIVKNLRAEAQPNALYYLYLELPPDTKPGKNDPHFVGLIHFFDAVGHVSGKVFRFDVTKSAKNLQGKGQLKNKPTLTIVPAGQPKVEAKPVIGEILFVEE